MSRQKTDIKHYNNTSLEKLLDQAHDPQTLQKMYHISMEVLTTDEEISYIAIQRKPLTGKAPDSVIFTDRRFIIYRPKMFGGAVFSDYTWAELKNVEREEGIMGSSLTMTTIEDKNIPIDYLPKAQARKLYSICREMQEKIRVERNACEIEAIISCNQRNCAKPAKIKRPAKNNSNRNMFRQTAQSGYNH